MIVGFTGTQAGMTLEQRTTLLDMLWGLQPTQLVHGDCVGSDAQAHAIAQRLKIDIIIHPPTNESKRAFCFGAYEIRKPADYLIRNENIVTETDMLIATPYDHTEQLRSGTWSTVRRARKQGKPIIVIWPDGSISEWNKSNA